MVWDPQSGLKERYLLFVNQLKRHMKQSMFTSKERVKETVLHLLEKVLSCSFSVTAPAVDFESTGSLLEGWRKGLCSISIMKMTIFAMCAS